MSDFIFEGDEGMFYIEMPTECSICGSWFDLNDGFPSKEWKLNIVICEDCSNKEKEYLDIKKDIELLEDQIDEYEWDVDNLPNTIKETEKELQNIDLDDFEYEEVSDDLNNLKEALKEAKEELPKKKDELKELQNKLNKIEK